MLKYATWLLGGLLALGVALGIFLAATLDVAKLKAELAQVIKEKKQRTLNIEGDVALSVWPSLGVKLGKTTLSEQRSEQLFAALDSAHISVAIFPLLKMQVVIDGITLSGVSASIVRHQDGSTNIDDLLKKDKEESQTVRFDITGIKIDNANLAYRDEKTDLSFTLAGMTLSTGKIANAAEGKLELAAKLTGERPRNNAGIKLAGRYRYDLDEKRYGLTGLEAKVTGEVYGLQGLDFQLTAAALYAQPAQGEMSVAGLALSSKGKLGDDNFDIKLDAPKLALTAERTSGDAINIALKLNGASHNADARLSLSGIEGTSKALKLAGFSLTLDAQQGDITLKAALQSPMQADLTALTLDLPALSGELNVALPRMPMKSVKLPITAKLHADLNTQAASGSLATQFDESKVDAKINVSHFSPLALAFDVDIDKLNVDKYLPPQTSKTEAGKASVAKPTAPEQPIGLSPLKAMNASGTIRIGQLQIANVKASKVRLDLKAADDKRDVAMLKREPDAKNPK